MFWVSIDKTSESVNEFVSLSPTSVWEVDGEVNWADGCDFPRQDFDHIPNTKKEACGELCLANPKCDHFTWDVRDNGKCWLKKWIGDNPSITRDGRRCGFVKRQASISTIQQPTKTTQEPRPQSTTTQRRPSGIGKNNITSN